jgi:glycolate oxidase iron-sulfur subunit
MQTNLADFIRDTPDGREAENILRKCVHCGFCTATCPTYQLLGDENDGPRGRIYLMKQMLEGNEVTARTRTHLDRCLTCRNCETTCPSGVAYGQLVDIGRRIVEERTARPLADRAKRWAVKTFLPNTAAFGLAMRLAQAFRPLLPEALAAKLPRAVAAAPARPTARHARRMVALAGCVQPVLTPATNAAAARVLDRVGISLIEAPGAGCCGAVRFHLNDQDAGRDDMRRLIDAWWPLVESGVEGFVMTASGCGATVREYGHHLADDPAYAAKAARIAAMTRDLIEVLAAEAPALRQALGDRKLPRVAFHPPCSLQHWQKLGGAGESLLATLGYDLALVPDAHLCCGSAGTYSLFQPEYAEQLKRNKVAALQSNDAELVLTANVGCETHLATAAGVPVKHWVVDLDQRLSG